MELNPNPELLLWATTTR